MPRSTQCRRLIGACSYPEYMIVYNTANRPYGCAADHIILARPQTRHRAAVEENADASEGFLDTRRLRRFDQSIREVGDGFGRVHAALERGLAPFSLRKVVCTALEMASTSEYRRNALGARLGCCRYQSEIRRVWGFHQVNQIPFMKDQLVVVVIDLAQPADDVRQ